MCVLSLPDPDQANAAIAFIALIVAATSVYFTNKGLKNQEKHNALSVVPVPFIALADYENHIRVKIRNDGIGPLIIRSLSYERRGKIDEHEDLVSYCPRPQHNLVWKNFSSGYVRSIRPGDDLILVEIELDDNDTYHKNFRDRLRKELSEITVTVNYSDVYGSSFAPLSRTLNFFARRLASSKAAKKA